MRITKIGVFTVDPLHTYVDKLFIDWIISAQKDTKNHEDSSLKR